MAGFRILSLATPRAVFTTVVLFVPLPVVATPRPTAVPGRAAAQEPSDPPQPDAAGGCPGAGGCCVAHGGIGCQDFFCCSLVCSAIPTCCEIGWDAECAGFASAVCEPSACSNSTCPGSGDCCLAHSSPGCQDEDCCNLVCSKRPVCCSGNWSTACATIAEALCDSVCGSGPICPGTGDCCFDTGGQSCNDAECCERVCAADDFCCTGEWDELCAGRANDICGEGNGDYCFDKWCPGEGGSCCTAHGTGGCERAACCEIVCLESPSCCANFWSGGCTSFAAELCRPTACACSKIGDLNGDGRIDLRDVARVQNCFTGLEGGPIGFDCACGDDDGDGTVDSEDWPGVSTAVTGPS